MTKLNVGDRVKYRREWLQSIGCQTGELPFARGKITELKPLGQTTLAKIDWECGDELPARVNTANITLASDPERM